MPFAFVVIVFPSLLACCFSLSPLQGRLKDAMVGGMIFWGEQEHIHQATTNWPGNNCSEKNAVSLQVIQWQLVEWLVQSRVHALIYV